LLYQSAIALKDDIPEAWRPGHDIFAEPDVHQCVLILHFEYHALLMEIFTIIAVTPILMPAMFTSDMACCREQLVGQVRNARRLLQTLDAIYKAGTYNPSLTSW
jgi:hypothetical protein